MGRYVWLVVASILLLAGCPTTSRRGVQPEAVSFDHPDEAIKAGGFMALADRRVFTAMAFVNAAGYDEETPGFSMHPVRIKVRQELAKRLADKPEKLQAYRSYCENVIVGNVRVFGYKSYILALIADYPFRRIRPDHELGYPFTAKALRGLPQILNEFWVTVNLGDIWEQVKPDYIAEIRKYDVEKMQRQMTFLWEYLRMTRSNSPIVVQIPDLLDHHLGAMGAGYEQYYYSVENPGNSTYGLNIHEYLHSVVNPLVEANYPRFQAKLDAYYMAGQDAPAVRDSYRQPVTFAFECMVGALNRRIGAKFENAPEWTRLMDGQVAQDTQEGLNLTLPFYRLLAEFEQSDKPFDEYLPVMLANLPEHGR